MGALAELVALIIIMCASVTMSLAQNPMPSPPSVENPNTTVVIHNALSGYWPMAYHCASKDVDFGLRRMPAGGSDQESAMFGCKRCEWKIREEGPCKLNKKTGMFDLCPPWDSQNI
ncbi:putative plant self-incompatibility S1 [Arabidopsis thaliana]